MDKRISKNKRKKWSHDEDHKKRNQKHSPRVYFQSSDDEQDLEEETPPSSPMFSDFGSSPMYRRSDSISSWDDEDESSQDDFIEQLERYRTIKDAADRAFDDANFFEALLYYNEAISMNSFDVDTYRKRCMTNLKLNYSLEAIKDSTKLLALQPNSVDAIVLHVTSNIRQGRSEYNLVNFNYLNNNSLLHGHFHSRSQSGMSQKYIEYFQKAITYCIRGMELDPTNKELKKLMESLLPYIDPFQALSDEMLLLVFSYLNAADLCVAAKVSKTWERVSSDNSLWSKLFSQEFTLFPGIKHTCQDWKKRYRSSFNMTPKPKPRIAAAFNSFFINFVD